jgi:hypothetical protein
MGPFLVYHKAVRDPTLANVSVQAVWSNDYMRRRLSSHQTILMKFIFPALWILLLGVSTIRLFFWGDIRTPPPWIFLFFWIAGSALWLFDAERLKYVSVDDDFLYVSNYFREIVIPLQDIYDVTENVWLKIHPVTLHLKHPSEFGDKIVFMPKTRFSFFSSHPVVKELKRLAKSHK